jgi:Tfp pilus assembly protein PilV
MVDATIKRRRGFTVAEILLALALISVVVLTLLGLALHSMTAGRKTRDLSAGQMVAEQVLERLVYDAESHNTDTDKAALWSHADPNQIYAQTQVTVEPSVFNVTTYVSDVNAAEFSPLQKKRLKRIQCVVVWQDAPEGKAGYGRLEVRATRLLHEEQQKQL